MHETSHSWLPNLSSLIIAGPCSAESEEQVLETAKAISKDPRVSLYRAGLWKPRSKPGTFEGVGAEGFPWFKKVKEETGLYTATEVIFPEHIDLAAEAGIDVVWIGARTAGSPPHVQQMAEKLKDYPDLVVLIKNPPFPDEKLLHGNTERLLSAGLKKVGLIHRGFYTGTGQYRNDPKWDMLESFKSEFPSIPIICDPSHIAGNRELLAEVIEQATKHNLNGLMIETHINPDEALSDAAQQVTPEDLSSLLDQALK